MHEIEYQDLNLLRVLLVLLEERGVTAAGRRLGLSPSAVSHSLARLRVAFDDPLLVRIGNRMEPTLLGGALQSRLERVLRDAARLYRHELTFDPETSSRTFRLAASDLVTPLVPRLVATLRRESPAMDLRIVDQVAGHPDALAREEIDVALLPNPVQRTGWETTLLGPVRFAVCGHPNHPFFDHPTRSAWAKADHIQVATGRPGPGFVETAAIQHGIQRRIALSVPSFLTALHTVAQTEILFTAPWELVAPLVPLLNLRAESLPLNLPSVEIHAVWQTKASVDPGHRWFREAVVQTLGWSTKQPHD